jgi:hypothetical protein
MSVTQPNANKDEIRSYFQSIMGWDVLKDPTIDIAMKHFTAEKLKRINTFLKTKVGKVFATKSPAMAVDISNIIGENLKVALAQPQQ